MASEPTLNLTAFKGLEFKVEFLKTCCLTAVAAVFSMGIIVSIVLRLPTHQLLPIVQLVCGYSVEQLREKTCEKGKTFLSCK